MQATHFIAFDLGATSGRTMLGTLAGGRLSMRELTRFPNAMVARSGRLHWDIQTLFGHLKVGLTAAAREGITVTSVGIDTWGVDFALARPSGEIIGMPYAYRDAHTAGAPEEFFARVMPREQVYALTGIQVMDFNSLYQLYALRRDRDPALAAAATLLFMPNALAYMLTGRMAAEYTIASTSQMLNPRTRRFEERILRAAGIAPELMPPLVMPGEVLGALKPEIALETGIGQIPVVSVAGHDTASAIAAIPAPDPRFAYISSGTWSLMGIETDEPVIDERTVRLNLTNEGGIDGTTRLLRNITGLWLAEQCLARWKAEGMEYTYEQMVGMAAAAPAMRCFIDPQDASFSAPEDMPAAIDAYCRRTGQPLPGDHGGYIRTVFESLALTYRHTLGMLRPLAPQPIERLHIIGGGSRNELLNRFAAGATGLPVVAGPAEATAIGNVMVQARSAGLAGDRWQMRRIIAGAVETQTFLPEDTALWDAAYERFLSVTGEAAPV